MYIHTIPCKREIDYTRRLVDYMLPTLLPPLNHNNMIPKPSLHFNILWIPSRARLKLISSFLERRIKTPACFPPE